MINHVTAKIKTLEAGDNVLVPVPECDRGRGDPANLIGVVLEKTVGRYRKWEQKLEYLVEQSPEIN